MDLFHTFHIDLLFFTFNNILSTKLMNEVKGITLNKMRGHNYKIHKQEEMLWKMNRNCSYLEFRGRFLVSRKGAEDDGFICTT